MRVFAPPGGGGELGLAGVEGGEDCALAWHIVDNGTIIMPK